MEVNRERPRDRKGRFKSTRAAPAAAAAEGAERSRPARKAKGSAKWSREKEAIFFSELAMVCNVSSALRKAKLAGSSTDAYERRKRDARFAGCWAEAIEQSYAMLELDRLERARFGNKRLPPQTEAERRLREIPDRLALQLLRLHQNREKGRPAGPAGRRRETPIDGAALRRKIDQRLSEMNRRMGGNG
jgi:hypothetical protein